MKGEAADKLGVSSNRGEVNPDEVRNSSVGHMVSESPQKAVQWGGIVQGGYYAEGMERCAHSPTMVRTRVTTKRRLLEECSGVQDMVAPAGQRGTRVD